MQSETGMFRIMFAEKNLIGEKVLTHWQVDELIGSGTYGNVYKAHKYIGSHITYAAIRHIVIPEPEKYKEKLISNRNNTEQTDKYFIKLYEDLLNQIRIMDELEGKSVNIVTYRNHEAIEHHNPAGYEIFIEMEYLKPLCNYCIEKNITAGEALKMGMDIASALEVSDSKDIMHHNIKESNIFIDSDGNFKLGDFAPASILQESSKARSYLETAFYKAPEAAAPFSEYKKTADIYSLGIILYRMFNNGRMPFLPYYPEQYDYDDEIDAMARKLRCEALPPPRCATEEIAEIILKACAPKPEERYETAGDMKAAIKLLLNELDRSVLEKPVDLQPAEKAANNDIHENVYKKEYADPVEKEANHKINGMMTDVSKNNDDKRGNTKKRPTHKIIIAIVSIILIIAAALSAYFIFYMRPGKSLQHPAIKIQGQNKQNSKLTIKTEENVKDNSTSEFCMYAVNEKGDKCWSKKWDNLTRTELPIASKYVVYNNTVIIEVGGNLYGISMANGTYLWEVNGVGTYKNEPVINNDDGTIYICGYDGPFITAVNADGSFKWRKDSPSADIGNPDSIELKDKQIIVKTEKAYCIYDEQGKLIKAQTNDGKDITPKEYKALSGDAVKNVVASSTLKEENIAHNPENVNDNDKSTAWVEGAAGDGIGEYVQLNFSFEGSIANVSMINGYAKSNDIYYKNNRVKKIRLSFSDGSSTEFNLEDNKMDYQILTLSKPVHTSYIKFTILEVYKGTIYQDTCISEIKIN